MTVVTHEFKRERFFQCHFPAVGLVPVPDDQNEGRRETAGRAVCLIGINPPPEVTPIDSLVQGEEKGGIGLWRKDLYGVGPDIAGKRAKRGWRPGMEDGVFVNVGLERAVEELVCWDGGRGNEWFENMHQLPWYSG